MGNISLGRVFGVNLTLNWTVVIIFALITFQLGAVVFPAWHPNWSAALSWAVAFGAAVVFLLSVIVHELSHAVVARAYDIPVRSISLFVFGGVAQIEGRPPHPRAEFFMAIVGPITSFVLGVAFIFASALMTGDAVVDAVDPMATFAALGPTATLLAWVGPINIVLAIFNMIPGFPLDGGRVLRAILWKATGDLVRATRWAAGVGRFVGAGFIAMGVLMAFGVWVPFFGTGLASGLWMLLIGWFLHNVASLSYQEVYVERMLDDVRVRDLMSPHPQGVDPMLTVRDLVDGWFMRTDQHAFPVVRNGELVGLVCQQDVRRVPRENWNERRVYDVMTPITEIVTVAPDDAALDALRKLGRRDVSQLPVVQDGSLLGLFRRRDITRWLELQADPRLVESHA